MFIDEQIQNLQRRIKNIEQNPRPEHMKSNKLIYELELENLVHTSESWKAGKSFACLGHVGIITRSLGFEPHGWIGWGDRVTDPQRYYDVAVGKLGFPEHTCDRTMTSLGLLLSGEVPIPRLVVGSRVACDPERWSCMAAGKFTGSLFFGLDKLSTSDYDGLRYCAEQVAELIEFAEKSIPGIRFDEERLIEQFEVNREIEKLNQENYELRKRVPCPLSSQDCFRLGGGGGGPNPRKALECARIRHEELLERVEKGIGGVPEEKLRIAWLATGPFGKTGKSTFDLLSRKGVSMVWFHYGIAPTNYGVIPSTYGDNRYGRKLTLLEEVARSGQYDTNTWGSTCEPWVDSLIQICQELKIDAVVDFLQVGCITTKNLKKITAQGLKEKVGIPTLDLEGREHFMTEAATIEMNKRLEEFLDLCITNKN